MSFLFNPTGAESPAVFASLGVGAGSKAAGLYLLKFGCQPLVVDEQSTNSNVVANRFLFNPAGEGPPRTQAVRG